MIHTYSYHSFHQRVHWWVVCVSNQQIHWIFTPSTPQTFAVDDQFISVFAPHLPGEALAVCFLLSSVSTSLGVSKVEVEKQIRRTKNFIEIWHFWWKIRIKRDNVNKINKFLFVVD